MISNSRVAIGLAAIIYTLSMFAQLFVDIIISREVDDSATVAWANFRTLILFVPTLLMLGLNMSLLRHERLKDLTRGVALANASLGLICAVLLPAIGYGYEWGGIFTVSACMLLGACYREKLAFIASQLALGGWKLFLLAGLLWGALTMETIWIVLGFFTFILAVIESRHSSLWPFSPRRIWSEIQANISLVTDGFWLVASATITGLAVGFSTFWAIRLLPPDDASSLFRLVTVCQAPAMFAAGFIGFVLTPIFRKNTAFRDRYRKRKLPIFAVVGLVHLILYPVFRIVFSYVFPEHSGDWVAGAAALLLLESAIRACYTLETADFGASFDKKNLRHFVFISILASAAAILAVFSVALITDATIIILIAISLLHWLVRLLIVERLVVRLN